MIQKHVGLIGCGRWGRFIARDLKTLGCRLSVADRSAVGRNNAERAGADAIVDDIDALPGVDGIVIATQTTMHLQVVEQVLERDVPVFCEKPLGHDAASACSLARRAGGQVFVMHKWRYHPGVQELARIARRAQLGPVIALATRRMGWGHDYPDVDAGWILLPHEYSIALEILGSVPMPRIARAEVCGRDLLAMMILADGEVTHSCEINTRAPVRERRVELRCRDGVAVLADAYADCVQIVRNPVHGQGEPAIERRAIAVTMPLYDELAAFLAYLEGGPPPKSSMAESAAIIVAIARARELAGLIPDAPLA